MSSYTEVGTACSSAIAAAISQALADYGLDEPAILSPFTGVGVPIADACDGMVWVRVGAVFPSDGSSQPYVTARAGWDVPAWCFPIEVGVLWCHDNITPDGSFIAPAKEAEYAARDGDYRLALLDAITYRWRPQAPDPLALAVMGQRLDVWQPIGPDGGYSGGSVVTYVISNALAICAP